LTISNGKPLFDNFAISSFFTNKKRLCFFAKSTGAYIMPFLFTAAWQGFWQGYSFFQSKESGAKIITPAKIIISFCFVKYCIHKRLPFNVNILFNCTWYLLHCQLHEIIVKIFLLKKQY